MTVRRYIIRPGWVRSQNDGDWHYIGATQLAHLYGLRQDQYIVFDHYTPDPDTEEWVPLYPRSDGNYTLPE